MKSEINLASGILHDGINTRVSTNAVDSNGKAKINAVANDILRIQRADGTTLYDSFELPFNPVDKTSRSQINNVSILHAINNNAVAANVYSKSEIYIALNLKSNKLTTYSKTDVNVALSILQSGIDNRVLQLMLLILTVNLK